MMLGRTAVLLLHAAAAFQFHENKCEPKTSLPTSEDSKRIAFILRGDAYRGLSYGSTARGSKRGFMCTPFAVRIQRAISASHVDYIIAPLERAGFVVGVFFATYGCVENAEAQLDRLKGFYDRNRTRVVHVDRIPRPGATQGDAREHCDEVVEKDVAQRRLPLRPHLALRSRGNNTNGFEDDQTQTRGQHGAVRPAARQGRPRAAGARFQVLVHAALYGQLRQPRRRAPRRLT